MPGVGARDVGGRVEDVRFGVDNGDLLVGVLLAQFLMVSEGLLGRGNQGQKPTPASSSPTAPPPTIKTFFDLAKSSWYLTKAAWYSASELPATGRIGMPCDAPVATIAFFPSALLANIAEWMGLWRARTHKEWHLGGPLKRVFQDDGALPQFNDLVWGDDLVDRPSGEDCFFGEGLSDAFLPSCDEPCGDDHLTITMIIAYQARRPRGATRWAMRSRRGRR